MNKKNVSNFKTTGIVSATNYSISGLRHLMQEAAIKRELIVIISSFLVYLYKQNTYTSIILALSFVLLAVEAINTAIEILCNHVTPDYHQDIKDIKDIASAAVFIVIFALLIFFAIFLLNEFNYVELLHLKLNQLILKIYPKKAELLFFAGTSYISIFLLINKRWILAKLIFLLGLIWVLFYEPVFNLIKQLGVDSFSETKNFDLGEAIFWFSTLSEVIKPTISKKELLFFFVLAISSFFLLKWILHLNAFTKKNYSYIKFFLSALFIGWAIQITFANPISLFLRNTESYNIVKKNFDNEPPKVQLNDQPINLFIYIGESSSAMNMGLYGYPRATTPMLEQLRNSDKNFIAFQNVFSTHTHTSPSLLEALSLPVRNDEQFLPINLRQRISIVDVLKKAEIEVHLVSNQGEAGTWNQASTIIFKNAKRTFSTKSSVLGNNDSSLTKPFDDEFFARILDIGDPITNNRNSKVTFFHSYAGHGPYLSNIPEKFRVPVDEYLVGKNVERIFGNDFGQSAIKNIEAYDSAIKYIDYSVSKSIQYVKNLKDPAIFIYFSDHGESVYSNRGHDSSRFVYEMAHIPFLIYFNNAAIQQDYETYYKYLMLSKTKSTATLAQLPAVILDLVGVKLDNTSALNSNLPKLIGMETKHPPIVVRELINEISYVNLNKLPFGIDSYLNYRLVDNSDTAMKMYQNILIDPQKTTEICQVGYHSLAEKLRHMLLASCSR